MLAHHQQNNQYDVISNCQLTVFPTTDNNSYTKTMARHRH